MNLSKSQERTRVNLPLPGIFGRAKLSIIIIDNYDIIDNYGKLSIINYEYLFSLSHEPAVCQAQKGI